MSLELHSLTVEQLVSGLNEKTPDDEASDCREGLMHRSDYCEELITRFEPLLRHAWRRGAFATEYQEYVQDVFLSLFRWLPQLRSPQAFPGFFRRIALSVAAEHARKSTRAQKRKDQEIDDQIYQLDETISIPIFIKSYLERLPHRERTVLTLNYLNDFDINEIARTMNLTDSEVRSLKHRGIKRLRDMLRIDTEILSNTEK